ncbi:hypothetical protein AKJ37_00140 [candidate division MSBL1 archaeon SCGC-AAA259I09]|uniref:Tyr recombinase domain-containing protein n=3 Tax=candidate division MSBL1 TaxID=215777 RepID=A0A133UW31_9EURY|nr:hypothetical protein AKJ61_00440 [candidate division MSBL1 archaeon SCGC-AAA259B11]KXA98407.1 hypothetical protein AKJ37_00140 [candidate division MSBL1 archaeon SCGC-AAA259I09]KXB00374.1 hypothetical protein AKJ40_01420 [candidate division MSBL1 archaeon SCGC-AAA259M10]
MKKFYKWLNDREYPERVVWIKTTRKNSNSKLPEKLLTEEDIEKLIETAENPRDKAFIALLWETGARIGELLDLRADSFQDRSQGKKVVINGKTGVRRLPIISSIPQLQNWLNNHSEKGGTEAPLWCKLSGEKRGRGDFLSLRYENVEQSCGKGGYR